MFQDGVDGVEGVNGEEAERGKSSSFYVPEKPANPGQSDPNMVCKNWLESPFDDVMFEETIVKKSFSCWNGNFGSTSQTLVDDTLSMFSCRDLLALAEASGGFAGETQHSGQLNLCDLNWPPQLEPPGPSLRFMPMTPDQTRRAEDGHVESDIVVPNMDKRMDLAADKDVVGNQDSEKGLTEEMNLNATPQKEQKRRKHRPKVITEGKPRRARKPATPKPPDGSGSSTGKRKYVRRKGVENLNSTATPETPGGDGSRETGGVIHPTPKQPDGSSTGKRKYVRRNKVEKSTETPAVDESNEAGGVIHPSPGRQSKKTCKRKINFDESEKQLESEKQNDGTVDKACTMTAEVVENYQKVHETESLSPITPSKTELPQVRIERSSTKAKCKINFLEETHDKGQIHVPNLYESGSSMSVCNKGDEAHSSKGGLSSEFDGIQLLHESHLEMCHDNLETFLSIFTDYGSGVKQCTQSSTINKRKGKAPEMSSDRYIQACGQNSKRKMVRNYVSFNERIDGGYQPQYTYMESHAADFQLSIPNKKRTKKSSVVPSSYHDYNRGYNSNCGYQTLYSAIDTLIVRLERLHIDRDAVVQGYHEKNALVVYQQDRSLVPYVKKRKQRPKVDLDEETNRVWMLLLEDINSQGVDGTDEDKAKWWEEERRVFRGRADSFIARMHLVQGDRRFSQWKGSVLDSVVGVFLTQNVSDHLSSSAFMSLAAQYPLKPNTNSEPPEMNTSSEPLHEEESGDHDVIPMMLQEADSCEEKEIINSNEFSKNCIISDNSECEVAELSEKDSAMCKESVINHIEVDEVVSSHNSADTCSMCKPEEQKDRGKATASECTSFVELLQMQGSARVYEGKIIQNNSERSASEESGISAESASQTIGQMINTVSSQESANSNCMVQHDLETTNLSTETSNASEINNIVENSQNLVQKVVDFHLNENGGNQIINHMDEGCSKVEIKKTEKKETKVDWDILRLQAESEQKRERTPGTMDSMDYEAIRAADVKDVAEAIKERGMNNRLAERIKEMLDRVVEDHGSIDLEWLRDVPPDKAKEYLLSFRGLGLKSVECIRLLTLQHLAFPVDTNVGRIAVRLGWVPLQALPESLQLHLLELYPIQESIQKYLWPRLCKLDQRTLYELHYQMITFGKVFCTKTKPNCNACPLRGECRHFASAFASARLALPAPEESIAGGSTEHRTAQNPIRMIDLPSTSEQSKQLSVVQSCNPVIEEPTSPEPIVEVPASPEQEQIQQELLDIEDFGKDTEEIPMIKLNIEEFTQNLQTYMEKHMELGEGDMSKALVALTSEAASIPTPKLKNVSQLRTEHQVYELPDSHPLLEGLDTREIDDPCSYLLAIWTPGESADSIQPPEGQCCSQESGTLCNEETCFFCNSTREANSQTVRGTLLIPCRTAMRGSFPLNGTYFQVNEVFADHKSSLNPIDVPRAWLWNLPRRTVYFGTSIPTIFKGLTTEEIQYCFWRGFVCVRGFDREKRAPRPLRARLHYPASRLKKPTKPKTDEKDKLMQQQ